MAPRLRRVKAVAEGFGIEVSKPQGGGSHWKAKKPGFRTYPVPAHNGEKTEIGDQYIRGLCRNFDLDPDEFKKRL